MAGSNAPASAPAIDSSFKIGKITVPDHNRDLPTGTLHIILKKAGLK
jgi:hypothetical protein